MVMDRIPAGKFKAQCLALLDEVAQGREIVVTKRGRPVAKVVPLEPPDDLRGSVTILVDEEELLSPIPVAWDAER
jgi:prevent-host-death family protein